MLNLAVLNEVVLNEIQTFSGVAAPTDILTIKNNLRSFSNENSGTATGARVLLKNLDFESGPSRRVEQSDVARGNGVNVSDVFETDWTIKAEGTIFHDSYAELNAYLETIKKDLLSQDFIVDIVRSGVLRRFPNCTVTNFGKMFSSRESYDITRCPFKLEFVNEGRAVDFAYTSQVATLTTSPDTDSVTTSGNAAAKGIFILVVNAANSVSEIAIENETNGHKMTITRSFSAGEALVIDGEAMSVQVNGTEVDFTGQFIELEPGENIIRYTVTSTSHTIDATIKHRNAYV